ncbi:methyltransferase regulatory domain-containing protein [Zavarzinella formosa]|uniref:methyltransferase regulatory domain-containing protein n=1 Tax=Zavarzinella formosa TaxID=360055 RepID=UPI0012FA40B5|nr:class I SAM-dependent methyltransferase [Zavarzinella formosa]
MSAPFAYDVVDYPSTALAQAHPSHLHAIARMFGCPAAPVERCRVLEAGCGDGLHLIACAVGLPESTFVGIDLSTMAVQRGNRMIAELGLENVTLHASDVTAWMPPAKPFDYAIAHGLYSWVPSFVRDAVLKLFATTLAPTGIGYVSYNTFPGCHIRRMLWDMLKFHSAAEEDPAAKIRQAVEMAQFLMAGWPAPKETGMALLKTELEAVLEKRNQQVLYHDDLSATNDPAYFHEFAAHARQFGMRFVAEAEPHLMETRGFPKDVANVLNGLASQDVLLKEQYLDFLLVRRFRQTLLAIDGRPPREDPTPAAITELFLSGKPKAEGDTIDLAPGVAVTFRATRNAVIRTDLPIGKAALEIIAATWPGRILFSDLFQQASVKIGQLNPDPQDMTRLAELLSAVWMAGMIELHGHQPTYREIVAERPKVCPLARLQARLGPMVTNRLHETMRFEDVPSRKLLDLLDGTRDRTQIAAELMNSFPPDQRPTPAALLTGLDRNLERLAKSGLLVD